jgi:hypothetical protein
LLTKLRGWAARYWGIGPEKSNGRGAGVRGEFKYYVGKLISGQKDVIGKYIQSKFDTVFADGFLILPLNATDPIAVNDIMVDQKPLLSNDFLQLDLDGTVYDVKSGPAPSDDPIPDMPDFDLQWGKEIQVSLSDHVLNTAFAAVIKAGGVPPIVLQGKLGTSMIVTIHGGDLHFLSPTEAEALIPSDSTTRIYLRGGADGVRADLVASTTSKSIHGTIATTLEIHALGSTYHIEAGADVVATPSIAADFKSASLKFTSLKLTLDAHSTLGQVLIKALQEVVDGIIWLALKMHSSYSHSLPPMPTFLSLSGLDFKIEGGFISLGVDKLFNDAAPSDVTTVNTLN